MFSNLVSSCNLILPNFQYDNLVNNCIALTNFFKKVISEKEYINTRKDLFFSSTKVNEENKKHIEFYQLEPEDQLLQRAKGLELQNKQQSNN